MSYKNIFNFMEDEDEENKKLLIDIIRKYYYNNDLPTLKEQKKIEKWFQLSNLSEIEFFLKNINDNMYDQMIEMVKIDNIHLDNEIGSVPHHKKCNLEVFMGSLDKIKHENDYLSWKQKLNINNTFEYLVSEKLDGISALLTINKKGKDIIVKLCTRGNGKIGCDISHLIKYINMEDQITNIVEYTNKQKDQNYPINIRGELIIPIQNTVNNINLRNIVSGIVHTKEINEEVKNKLNQVEFISYRLYNCNKDFHSQFNILNKLNFKIPQYKLLSNPSFNEIKNTLEKFINESKYQIDGIVISQNLVYNRDPIDKNPEHSIALKNISKTVETEVLEVEWNVSKHGILKPRIKVNSVCINGVNIEWVTGFNGKYIHDNQIGKGTILEIERSGDVIPNIKKVIKSTKAELPRNINWNWSKTSVDIYVNEENNDEMEIKKILTFFQELECPHLGPKTIETIYENGFTSIPSFLSITKIDLLNTGKYKDKSADNILQGIQVCKDNLIEIVQKKEYVLMYASGCFGFGIGNKKIKLILDNYPNIINEYNIKNRDKWIENIKSIKGIFDQAELFVDNIEKYKLFYKSIKSFINIDNLKNEINKENKDIRKCILKNENIVFTGFRDNTLKKMLEDNGNVVNDTVTKSSTLLVYENNESSSKCIKAKNMGIKIIEKKEFLKML